MKQELDCTACDPRRLAQLRIKYADRIKQQEIEIAKQRAWRQRYREALARVQEESPLPGIMLDWEDSTG